MKELQHLGFPVPLLGGQPERLPVLFDDGELIVLGKPVGVLVEADSWYPKLPVLVEAIRYQAQGEKPEFVRRGIGKDGLWAVHGLDPDCYGPVLFARNRDQAEELRNAFGSNEFSFTFGFLSNGAVAGDRLECDLPMARHSHQRRMLVSHTTGKKACTAFEREESVGSYCLWSARTSFPRHQQILLHAYESGLPVLGDSLYARLPLPLLSKLKRHYTHKEDVEERPLYGGPAYYLRQVDLPSGQSIQCVEPPRWGGLVKQLKRHSC